MNRRWFLMLSGGILAWVALALPGATAVDAARPIRAATAALSRPQSEAQKERPSAKHLPEAAGRGRRERASGPIGPSSGPVTLSAGDSYDDFPSLAQTRDGTVYAAYAAYYDGHDQIRLHRRLPDGRWSTRTYVPLAQAQADIWMPQLAVDAKNRLWVIWSEQVGQSRNRTGNWDLYARCLAEGRWGPLVRLTNDPKPDINHHVATDKSGRIFVVWQAHPKNNGDIMLCRFDGNQWSKPLAVTSDPASDWYPQVAVDQRGVVWIAFDSYRNGDYDVFLTSVAGDRVGKLVPVACSGYYEAQASVACTPDGRVWVAWEQGGYNWGKDQGHWLAIQGKDQGTRLGSTRTVQVAAYHNGKLWSAPAVAELLGGEPRNMQAMATLAVGKDGRLWLRFRRFHLGGPRGRGRRRRTRYWTEAVTWLTRSGWAKPMEMPDSTGRISVFSRLLPADGGSLWIAYSSDQRRPAENAHIPRHDVVRLATVARPAEPAGTPELAPYQPPQPPENRRPWNQADERKQVAAIREHRATIGGKACRIVRGDLHRHTELSWDVGPADDGSYLDFYRYMIDVADMDFGGLTDHQGGGHYAYWWWLTEKSADMYYLPPRFVPLYGYERSVRFPNGHRNIFHSYRGVPVFPFQLQLDQTGIFPGIGTGAVLDNDTRLLYEYLHRTGGIAISHTSATGMGTDWRDNDPQIEPVVEIYQGCRNSYEVLGGPRVHDPKSRRRAPGGFKPEGLVWNAWAKGYRLGTIAASDHTSTHISYALVYTPDNDRSAILDSIRARHTYGATDNIIVDFTANGHFMGDEFTATEKPTLQLKVTGTAPVARVDLIRNNKYIYRQEPGETMVAIKYVDADAAPGLNMYYFRILQEDGQVAWASPVWINLKQ